MTFVQNSQTNKPHCTSNFTRPERPASVEKSAGQKSEHPAKLDVPPTTVTNASTGNSLGTKEWGSGIIAPKNILDGASLEEVRDDKHIMIPSFILDPTVRFCLGDTARLAGSAEARNLGCHAICRSCFDVMWTIPSHNNRADARRALDYCTFSALNQVLQLAHSCMPWSCKPCK